MRIAELVRLRWLLGTLLIVGAALFAVGVATEGGAHHDTAATIESGEHDEATEQGELNEQTEASESGERILGINLESPPPVVVGVVVSVALAAATWRRDHRLVLLVTALFAVVFAVLDVAELAHQIGRSAATIAVIAGITAIVHAAAALLAERRRTSTP